MRVEKTEAELDRISNDTEHKEFVKRFDSEQPPEIGDYLLDSHMFSESGLD